MAVDNADSNFKSLLKRRKIVKASKFFIMSTLIISTKLRNFIADDFILFVVYIYNIRKRIKYSSVLYIIDLITYVHNRRSLKFLITNRYFTRENKYESDKSIV